MYVDAAEYTSRDAMALAVVNRQGDCITSGSVWTTDPEVGEEVAIALAMVASSKTKVIVSDSKSAILNYARGCISPEAFRILKSGLTMERDGRIQLIWAPAHSGLAGNECAHDAARGFTDRADVETPDTEAHSIRRSGRDRLVFYRDIVDHYRLERAKYPAPDKTLSKWQSVAWRRLQTDCFPNPVAYSRCYPGTYSDKCKACGDRADLHHMVWSCPLRRNDPPSSKAGQPAISISSKEQWETALLSSDPGIQTRLVQMATTAARDQGLLTDG